MKKIVSFICALIVTSALFAGCGAGSGSNSQSSSKKSGSYKEVTITNSLDGKNFKEKFTQKPKRAVSLAGFTTEMMLSLGLKDSMVGRAYQDNKILDSLAKDYAKVPKLSDQNPSKEKLLDTQPDFLIGWSSSFSNDTFNREFCKKNNIKMYVPKSIDSDATMKTVYEDFNNLGKIFGVEEKSDEITQNMKKQIKEVQDKIKDSSKSKKRVFVYDSGEDAPFTASGGVAKDIISLAGGQNIFGDIKKSWSNVTWEQVVDRNPEYIIIVDYDSSKDSQAKKKFLMSNPALKNVDAIKNNRIFVVGLTDLEPGIRDSATVKSLAEKFYPEAFKN